MMLISRKRSCSRKANMLKQLKYYSRLNYGIHLVLCHAVSGDHEGVRVGCDQTSIFLHDSRIFLNLVSSVSSAC
jgi:hypothetical protein